MERKLVTIRRVDQVWKHPGADRLDLLQVGGWQLVSGIGNFQPGDLCVYHEIDCFLPISHPAYADLTKTAVKWTDLTGVEREGHRLKTVKLRGEVSQGYALKPELFPELMQLDAPLNHTVLESLLDNGTAFETDLATLLGVVKWEKIVPMGGSAKGSFPSHTPKTDEERIQNLFNKFGNRGEMRVFEYTNAVGDVIKVEKPYEFCRDDEWEVTVKLDGTSMTVFRRDDEFGVCSRNNELVETDENAFWKTTHELKLRERMNQLGRNLSLQGELYGPGIQGNLDKLPKLGFYVFNVFDIDRHKYLTRPERMQVIEDLNKIVLEDDGFGRVDLVPTVAVGRKFDFPTVQDVLAYAEGQSIAPGTKREGVVFKSLQDPDVSFKVISNSYLLKHDA